MSIRITVDSKGDIVALLNIKCLPDCSSATAVKLKLINCTAYTIWYRPNSD